MIKKKVKALHALNLYYGNICSRKCPPKKQREHYEKMRGIIKGHEDFLITHKMFIKIMREKHNICGLSDEEIKKGSNPAWVELFCNLTNSETLAKSGLSGLSILYCTGGEGGI
ncbi:MAG: hypothetical protein V1707_01925 [bacterium]